MVALCGDSVVGENRSDCGMRKRRKEPGPLAVVALVGVGGGREAAEADLGASPIVNEPLTALAGWDVGE